MILDPKRKGPRINKHIKSPSVRLIDESGNMVGVIDVTQALSRAQNVNLDLVEVNPNSNPPVCKILDYGKIKYEKQKQLHKARKKHNVNIVKEVKIRPNIGENDYLIKMRNIRSFLEDKYRVKISLRFRGREMMFQDDGMKLLNKIIEDTEDVGMVESKPNRNNNLLILVLSAK
ncbi:MAG: translation initiation factor IF-3 [Rickettsiaceae bacterium H1]|nr:translation initiation factor IF-3 [Rickettsiaceae bacterium H1]